MASRHTDRARTRARSALHEGNGHTSRVQARVEEYPEAERGDANEGNAEPEALPLPIITAGVLVHRYPELRPAVIDGLLRAGETMNLIAAPKIGKSWLTYGLALAVATGKPWLDTFDTTAGRVLLVDNELHPETIAHRLPNVAAAMGIPWSDVADRVDVLALRGRLLALPALASGLRLQIKPGQYTVAIVDAMYRVLPATADENANRDMAAVYDTVDNLADLLQAAFVLVHHSSKGNQSEKSLTDVGSGAGSQSRAADTHLVLRPHEQDNVIVLDAAARSWPPLAARCLRWEYPLWVPALDLDPTQLRIGRPRKATADKSPPKTPEPPWTARRFADTFGQAEPQPRSVLLDSARAVGLSNNMAETLLRAAIDGKLLYPWPDRETGRTLIATVPPADTVAETADDTAVLTALDVLDPSQEGVSCKRVREGAGLSEARQTQAVVRLMKAGVIERITLSRGIEGIRRAPANAEK